jgi:DNA polymerase-1
MKYHLYGEGHVTPYGVDPEEVLVLDLMTGIGKKKLPVKEIKNYITEELVDVLTEQNIKYVLCTDSDYFKVLTGAKKVDPYIGYVLSSTYGEFHVVYVPNHKAVFYNPERTNKAISAGVKAMLAHREGTYKDPGTSLIKQASYPGTTEEIKTALQILLDMNCPLTCDIETFTLKHHSAGIATIAFAWNQEEGIAFAVDYVPLLGSEETPYGCSVRNQEVRDLLVWFFENQKQKIIYHNIAFDVYVLIYQLFMKDLLDNDGLLHGIEVMLSSWEDTKLIAYLATNSCAGNKLSLKDLAQEFAGNYAQEEIKNVLNIPLKELLEYNLVDSISTWFVYDSYYQRMIDDQQLDIYENLFKDTTVDIIQMQLTGMPLNIERVLEVKQEMENDYALAENEIKSSILVQEFTHVLNEQWIEAKNAKYKKKRITISDATEEFNPNSGPQLQKLLFEFLGLPILGLTDSKQPSTDGDTLKALQNHTTDPNVLVLLKALTDHKSVEKILTSFIPPMINSIKGPDGWNYLFGNINLGGTVSGRLSSSKPNLQNLPANSKYGKLIKSCFEAPPGYLFVGLDFAQLEARIDALTTKDPMKLAVYLDGFDSHSLASFFYFRDQMPDIVAELQGYFDD